MIIETDVVEMWFVGYIADGEVSTPNLIIEAGPSAVSPTPTMHSTIRIVRISLSSALIDLKLG
jgi:hypothetical protein